MIARTLTGLRAWWADSPRARRLPSALALPLVAAIGGGLCAAVDPGPGRWVFLACALMGVGFGIYTTTLVLLGRDVDQ